MFNELFDSLLCSSSPFTSKFSGTSISDPNKTAELENTSFVMGFCEMDAVITVISMSESHETKYN